MRNLARRLAAAEELNRRRLLPPAERKGLKRDVMKERWSQLLPLALGGIFLVGAFLLALYAPSTRNPMVTLLVALAAALQSGLFFLWGAETFYEDREEDIAERR